MSGDSATVRNRALIINNLGILIKGRAMITAALGGKDTILTAVVDVNSKTGQVILDTSPSPVLNAKMLLTRHVRFTGVFNGVQVAFSGESIEKIKHKGYDAFIMPLPSSLYWFDRRNAFRIKTPTVNSAILKIRLKEPNEESKELSNPEYKANYKRALVKIKQKMTEAIKVFLENEQKAYDKAYSRMTAEQKEIAKLEREQLLEDRKLNPLVPDEDFLNVVDLEMSDISMTGCSAINVDEEFSFFLAQSMRYEDCIIEMPDHGVATISLEIMMQRRVESEEIEIGENKDEINEFVGFKFFDAKQTAESVIFRYIQLLDRIAKKK